MYLDWLKTAPAESKRLSLSVCSLPNEIALCQKRRWDVKVHCWQGSTHSEDSINKHRTHKLNINQMRLWFLGLINCPSVSVWDCCFASIWMCRKLLRLWQTVDWLSTLVFPPPWQSRHGLMFWRNDEDLRTILILGKNNYEGSNYKNLKLTSPKKQQSIHSIQSIQAQSIQSISIMVFIEIQRFQIFNVFP